MSIQVVLAVGDNFPDPLAAGPFAATQTELDRRQPADRIYVGAAQPN